MSTAKPESKDTWLESLIKTGSDLKVRAWYDEHQHLWAIAVQDAGGDRVGAVQYAPTPFSMHKVIEDLKREYHIEEHRDES